MAGEIFVFGDVTVDVTERRVTRHGGVVSLPPKTFDVLEHLLRRAGHLVTKADLLAAVWRDAFVEEGILAVHVSALRKALGGGPARANCIETVARRGYRFIASVAVAGAASPPPGPAGPSAPLRRRVLKCTSSSAGRARIS